MGILILSSSKSPVSLSETVSLSDILSALAGKAVSETVSLSDFLSAAKIQNLSLSETVSLSDMLSAAKIQNLTADETVSLSDFLSALPFRPNKPLQKYQTRLLVSMELSQTHSFSSEEIDA